MALSSELEVGKDPTLITSSKSWVFIASQLCRVSLPTCSAHIFFSSRELGGEPGTLLQGWLRSGTGWLHRLEVILAPRPENSLDRPLPLLFPVLISQLLSLLWYLSAPRLFYSVLSAYSLLDIFSSRLSFSASLKLSFNPPNVVLNFYFHFYFTWTSIFLYPPPPLSLLLLSSILPNIEEVLLGASEPGLAWHEGRRHTKGAGGRERERIDFPVGEAFQWRTKSALGALAGSGQLLMGKASQWP